MQPFRIKSITEYHRAVGLPKPEHPLISVVDITHFTPQVADGPISVVFDFYVIALKRVYDAQYKYGQQTYDYDEGIMSFTAPGQVMGFDLQANAPPKTIGLDDANSPRFFVAYLAG